MTDLEMTKQLLERMHFSYIITNLEKCIAMDVFEDMFENGTVHYGNILFNFDGSFKEENE